MGRVATDLSALYRDIRDAADDRMWGAAVKLARAGAVDGVSDDGDELQLWVKAPNKPVRHEVWLWPDDADWGLHTYIHTYRRTNHFDSALDSKIG